MAAIFIWMSQKLLKNIHVYLADTYSKTYTVCGEYEYFHYGCDGLDDRGWGCGYRTLQSMCSWLKHEFLKTGEKRAIDVPSIHQIQDALVTMGDKSETFRKSREWIGSFECCLCIDYFYDVPCKILHVNSGKELQQHLDEVIQHFRIYGSPIMMGGESDTSSKGIVGACNDPPAFLIMDPHYYGETRDCEYLQEHGWLKWRLLHEFEDQTFYNLCLPRLKSSAIT